MSTVFGEVARVLADDGLATVVFHSAKASIWRSLVQAYRDARLSVEQSTSVLDKTQASFKQVVATTKVMGDPLILLSKTTRTRAEPSIGRGDPRNGPVRVDSEWQRR